MGVYDGLDELVPSEDFPGEGVNAGLVQLQGHVSPGLSSHLVGLCPEALDAVGYGLVGPGEAIPAPPGHVGVVDVDVGVHG